MRIISITFLSILLTTSVFAGPEEVKMTIDFSPCQENNFQLEIDCEQYDHITDQIIRCQFAPAQNKTLEALISGDTYVDVSGTCNGRKRHCLYHFKPSTRRNVQYSDEIVTQFPNPKTITVPLINIQLPILKVECD